MPNFMSSAIYFTSTCVRALTLRPFTRMGEKSDSGTPKTNPLMICLKEIVRILESEGLCIG